MRAGSHTRGPDQLKLKNGLGAGRFHSAGRTLLTPRLSPCTINKNIGESLQSRSLVETGLSLPKSLWSDDRIGMINSLLNLSLSNGKRKSRLLLCIFYNKLNTFYLGKSKPTSVHNLCLRFLNLYILELKI